MEPSKTSSSRDFWLATLRGMIGRCPRCGGGRLLRNYLKPVEHCSACGEAYGHIRADDGPAWLTIVVVGHILGTVMLTLVPNSNVPTWVLMAGLPLLAIAIALVVLPRAKGLFIAWIWQHEGVKKA